MENKLKIAEQLGYSIDAILDGLQTGLEDGYSRKDVMSDLAKYFSRRDLIESLKQSTDKYDSALYEILGRISLNKI